MAILFLIARIVFGGYWLLNAWNHFKNSDSLAQYAASKGTPAPKLAVLCTGLLLLIAGVTMILGAWTRIGILAIAIFLIPVTFIMSPYWKEQDPTARMNAQINFRKNMALLAASVMLLMIPLPWALSLGM